MHLARLVVTLGVLGGAAAAFAWAMRPVPLDVDLVTVARAPMAVTVSAEGMTRVREPWTVSAPLTGTVARSPLQVGDAVVAGQTVVAEIEPAAPALLDARARGQAEAAVTEAEAALRLSEVNLERAKADLDYADGQLARTRELAARGIVAQSALEASQQLQATRAAARDAAEFELALQRATLARAQALLVGPEAALGKGTEQCCVQIFAPHSGRVLSIVDESARLVQAGSPLLTIGDLTDLEIEVDLLSADAVRVPAGALAEVERWGGPGILAAEVRRIDPAAFTRVSALGIEEQRVRLRLAFLDPPETRVGLGDRYRVYVRIVVWSDPDVLQVPVSALFRQGEAWATFRELGGRAVLTEVQLGQMTGLVAEVKAGLAPGDRVVAYPGNRVSAGSELVARLLP
ncbi:efflux RND transporter periplasmic adaptor subunit [Phaeovulum sp.]|uniref:efflux RND transporter periplasmic adaptor subunit n=1 Tax=Phaeovulum sp. TaxID=2934796 RepID=UPI00272F8D07|nr:HlyD family efflux transporter periplasmic adaptor subunit [Phaeovulum sp.]MDP1667777.1 HlyD family efflux transporter periplasmic adaptor subunit [Phaeovulum sp.]MDZ4119738.1 HlyD family efflux transporter periplasmic adaptor subunit [Phaeovulum sp.]